MQQRSEFKNSLDWEYYLEKQLPLLEKAWLEAINEIGRLQNHIDILERKLKTKKLEDTRTLTKKATLQPRKLHNKVTLTKKATPPHPTKQTAQPRK